MPGRRLTDANDALETVARRSEGLLHFVQNHRRLTKPLVTQMQEAPVRRESSRGFNACSRPTWRPTTSS